MQGPYRARGVRVRFANGRRRVTSAAGVRDRVGDRRRPRRAAQPVNPTERIQMTTARKGGRIAALAIAGALAATGVTSATASATAGHKAKGHVYTLTNAAAGNAVLVFDRAADGVADGGRAACRRAAPAAVRGLGSQGAVVARAAAPLRRQPGQQLGDGLRVRPWGLEWLDTAPSGRRAPDQRDRPRRLVYVLNDGGDGNVSGSPSAPAATSSRWPDRRGRSARPASCPRRSSSRRAATRWS